MKFVVECEMKDRWVPYFLQMLRHMEKLGSWGSSRWVGIYSDGDGDFRPKFKYDKNLPDIAMTCKSTGQIIKITEGDHFYDAG